MDKESQRIFEGLWELHDRYDEDPKHMICADGAEQIKKLCEEIDALEKLASATAGMLKIMTEFIIDIGKKMR